MPDKVMPKLERTGFRTRPVGSSSIPTGDMWAYHAWWTHTHHTHDPYVGQWASRPDCFLPESEVRQAGVYGPGCVFVCVLLHVGGDALSGLESYRRPYGKLSIHKGRGNTKHTHTHTHSKSIHSTVYTLLDRYCSKTVKSVPPCVSLHLMCAAWPLC